MKNLSHITAAILAGGLGSRLRPVVADRPKVLAEVGGRPFIFYLLDQLAAVSVQRVVLCTGYLADLVKDTLGETYGPMNLLYSREPSPLGTGGALCFALPLLESETVLVLNGDSFCEANLRAFCLVHCLRRAQASLLLAEVTDTGRFGWVELDGEGRITGFLEKGKATGSGWVNGGIYLINRSLLDTIPPQQIVSLEQGIFPAWIGRGLYGFRIDGRFLDIGTPESYAAAEEFFLQQEHRNFISPQARDLMKGVR
jgi:D-glycero-alpha-D-manno-heptose 1-phosphate guanylyltransferase